MSVTVKTLTTTASPRLSPVPTKSFWHTREVWKNGRAVLPILPEHLEKRHATDICIVGAGIAGCSLAYHLTRLHPAVTVTVVDGRHLAGGATGRNGGLMWPCLNASLQQLVDSKGTTAASQIMNFEEQASKHVTKFLLETPGMQELTEFQHYSEGGLILFASEEEASNELHDVALAQSMGHGHHLTVWDAEEANRRLGSRGYFGAIQMPGVGRVWAARLTLGLALEAARNAAPDNGNGGSALAASSRLALMEAAEVIGIESIPAPEVPSTTSALLGGSGLDRARSLSVKTSRGDVIDCRAVVHCTNAYSSGLVPELQGLLTPVRNQVVVTSPLPANQRIPLDAAVYARQGYVYWSPRADNRLVLGGFRDVVPHKEEGTFDDGHLDPWVSECIRSYLPNHFPELFSSRENVRVEMEWAGILGFTRDRFPLVGALPLIDSGTSGDVNRASREGQYICAGFSGHGMTRAFSCAEGLARQLLGLPEGTVALPSVFGTHNRI